MLPCEWPGQFLPPKSLWGSLSEVYSLFWLLPLSGNAFLFKTRYSRIQTFLVGSKDWIPPYLIRLTVDAPVFWTIPLMLRLNSCKEHSWETDIGGKSGAGLEVTWTVASSNQGVPADLQKPEWSKERFSLQVGAGTRVYGQLGLRLLFSRSLRLTLLVQAILFVVVCSCRLKNKYRGS